MGKVTLFIEHSLVYSNRHPVPVEDVLASLEGMRRVTKTFLPSTLSKLTGSKILEAQLLVDGFDYGSFKESFWLQLIFSSERSMKRFQKAFRAADLAGMYKELPMGNKPVVKTIVVSSVIASLLTYGALKYVGASGSASDQALVAANNNTIIMIGAEAYQVSPKDFLGIIEAVTEGRHKHLAQDAAKVLAPAKGEPGAKLDFGGGLEVPRAVVDAMPREPEFEANESEQAFTNVLIDIRQTNRDSDAHGWRGRIANMFDDRVKLTLGDGVALAELVGKLEVRADVVVRYRMNSRKVFVPVEITIEQVHGAAGPA